MSKQGITSLKKTTTNSYDSKKFTYVRSPRFTPDMTSEEEARAINEMSEAIVDAVFGVDFGKETKEKMRKQYEKKD